MSSYNLKGEPIRLKVSDHGLEYQAFEYTIGFDFCTKDEALRIYRIVLEALKWARNL